MRRYLPFAGLLAVVVVSASPAWWVKGHESITEAAAMQLPEEMPAFFRNGGKQMAHFAGDPDRWKNRSAIYLSKAEGPDHFIDWEHLNGEPLPPNNRYEAGRLLSKLKQRPDRTGLLPYAIMEHYDRLSCAFKDYRDATKDKSDPALLKCIEWKCLVYAGVLSHFTADTCMPLHTTENYDGRKGKDGKFEHKGIHADIDAFPEKNGFTPEMICRTLKTRDQIEDPWKYILDTIQESRRHIDRCYDLYAAGKIKNPDEESRKFILERCQASAQFTMDLWYQAWLRSEKMPAHY